MGAPQVITCSARSTKYPPRPYGYMVCAKNINRLGTYINDIDAIKISSTEADKRMGVNWLKSVIILMYRYGKKGKALGCSCMQPEQP